MEDKCCSTCEHRKLPPEPHCEDPEECRGSGQPFEYLNWKKKEIKMKKTAINPAIEQSTGISDVTDYLNEHLFEGKLPRAMVIFTRNPKVIGGYFSPSKWFNSNGQAVDEVAINANTMVEGDEIELFQVLIHELSHQWQFHRGTPGRGGYHNREWADFVMSIGLKPINVQDPDAETGDSITTVLITGGKAMKVLAGMPEELTIPFYSEILGDPTVPAPDDNKGDGIPDETPVPKPKSGSRTKYTCSQCGTNLWGKAELHIQCIPCERNFVEMQ